MTHAKLTEQQKVLKLKLETQIVNLTHELLSISESTRSEEIALGLIGVIWTLVDARRNWQARREPDERHS